jgi:hypothetical protein
MPRNPMAWRVEVENPQTLPASSWVRARRSKRNSPAPATFCDSSWANLDKPRPRRSAHRWSLTSLRSWSRSTRIHLSARLIRPRLRRCSTRNASIDSARRREEVPTGLSRAATLVVSTIEYPRGHNCGRLERLSGLSCASFDPQPREGWLRRSAASSSLDRPRSPPPHRSAGRSHGAPGGLHHRVSD